jgi:hypothetical protein
MIITATAVKAPAITALHEKAGSPGVRTMVRVAMGCSCEGE